MGELPSVMPQTPIPSVSYYSSNNFPTLLPSSSSLLPIAPPSQFDLTRKVPPNLVLDSLPAPNKVPLDPASDPLHAPNGLRIGPSRGQLTQPLDPLASTRGNPSLSTWAAKQLLFLHLNSLLTPPLNPPSFVAISHSRSYVLKK